MQVSVHADGESCAACPPPYADQPQGQLQRQHTNAQQTLEQHETYDRKKKKKKNWNRHQHLARYTSLRLEAAPRVEICWLRLRKALCTFDLNRAAAFNLSLFIYLDESFKSGRFASAVNEGDVFVKA